MSQERIGRYGILDWIAAGGQATVYRAWDSETGQVVALKVLHPHLTHDADYIKRFQLEARITHPNVINVFEVAQHGDNHFISMEYLPESLSRVLEVQGRHAYGTGPFIMTIHQDGGTSFERNPVYWNEGLPLLDKVTFIYMSNAEELAAELMAGGIDVIYDLDVGSVDSLRDHPDTVVTQAPSGSYMNLAMDVRQPPFDDVRVRRALQAVTDREAILQVALRGLGGIAYDHPVAEGDPLFFSRCMPPEYNPDLARRLLAEAGYRDGIDLTLYTSNAGAPMADMAKVFARSAAAAGIRVDVVVAPDDGYWTDVWLQKPFTTSWWTGRPPPTRRSALCTGPMPDGTNRTGTTRTGHTNRFLRGTPVPRC